MPENIGAFIYPASVATVDAAPLPSVDGGSCPTCAAGSSGSSYVYAIGKIEARFPSLSVEKEFAQATGRADTKGMTDSQAMHEVVSRRENRYLARQLCWVMTIASLETYILVPREAADLDLLIEALRAEPKRSDVDVIVGIMGPMAPASMCNGLTVPIVAFDQIYSFDVASFIEAIPRPDSIAADQFKAVAEEVFNRVIQVADNAGSADGHRALNYMAMRYPALYAAVAQAYARDASLAAVEVQPSILSGTRQIVDVVFSFSHRSTGVTEKQFARIDVTDKFPFLVTKLSPRYDIVT
jgi:hypothetical protein